MPVPASVPGASLPAPAGFAPARLHHRASPPYARQASDAAAGPGFFAQPLTIRPGPAAPHAAANWQHAEAKSGQTAARRPSERPHKRLQRVTPANRLTTSAAADVWCWYSKACLPRGTQKVIEDGRAIEQFDATGRMKFGMPLQAHHKTRALVADRLDDIVALRHRFDRDIAPQVLDGLVVDGIDQRFTRLWKQARQGRAFREDDGMAVAVIQIVHVGTRAFHVGGDILVQGT